MILVDTSIWIDHFHASEAHLVRLLDRDDVGSHPLVVEELALGSLLRRQETLTLVESLTTFPSLSHVELLQFVDGRDLWGRGLSPVDAHLLGAVRLVGGAQLWTRDKRLRAAAVALGVAHAEGPVSN
ncbi:VapC toxin family PIN domain ribonuclease [Tersicoccus phoenicis]|uniref:Ribonuclease VapC n=1 Tax=Tersicoccus phoenicis TaxID=554083 RepID=A0A1R1LBR9_9MICC|nr:type II toxin-antitoxin system VapC family toxin [Tersicoccus phoenicis]OMH24979.1 VapC toxin family PIN domain ribonuclease [Tersicoccus phoenicis]